VTGKLRGQAQVRPIDKLDRACTNADDRMMLVQHRSGNRVTSSHGFGLSEQRQATDFVEPAGGRAAQDSLHDARARLKISSQ